MLSVARIELVIVVGPLLSVLGEASEAYVLVTTLTPQTKFVENENNANPTTQNATTRRAEKSVDIGRIPPGELRKDYERPKMSPARTNSWTPALAQAHPRSQ
jgi:hypothetical protein